MPNMTLYIDRKGRANFWNGDAYWIVGLHLRGKEDPMNAPHN